MKGEPEPPEPATRVPRVPGARARLPLGCMPGRPARRGPGHMSPRLAASRPSPRHASGWGSRQSVDVFPASLSHLLRATHSGVTDQKTERQRKCSHSLASGLPVFTENPLGLSDGAGAGGCAKWGWDVPRPGLGQCENPGGCHQGTGGSFTPQ